MIAPESIRSSLRQTQAEIAISCDLSVSTISYFEAGTLRNPSVRTVRKLSSGYNLTIEQVEELCGISRASAPASP